MSKDTRNQTKRGEQLQREEEARFLIVSHGKRLSRPCCPRLRRNTEDVKMCALTERRSGTLFEPRSRPAHFLHRIVLVLKANKRRNS